MDLTRSSVKLLVANGTRAVTSFVGIVYFARYLGSSAIGSFFLFEALVGMLAIPADLGIRSATEKRISGGQSADDYLSTALLLKILPLLIVSVFVYLFQSIINEYLGGGFALFLILGIVISELGQLMIFVIRGELRVGETAILQVSQDIVWILTGAILIHRGYGVHGLIYGFLLGLTVTFVWGYYKCNTSFGRPSLEYVTSLLDYSRYAFISRVGGYFYQWMDIVIIGIFLTQTDVAAYEIAWRVTLLVMIVSKAIGTSIFPVVSEWSALNDKTEIERMIPDAIVGALIFAIPSFFGSVLFSKDILRLLFGQEYVFAWLVLIILMAEKLLQAPHLILGKSLQGMNRPDLAAYSAIVTMAINLVLNVVFIWWIGIVGAALATMISFGVNTVLHAYFLSNVIQITFPYKKIGWCLLSGSVMTAILLYASRFLLVTSLTQLFGIVSLGALVYLTLVLLYPPLRGNAWSILKSTRIDR